MRTEEGLSGEIPHFNIYNISKMQAVTYKLLQTASQPVDKCKVLLASVYATKYLDGQNCKWTWSFGQTSINKFCLQVIS